MSECNVCSEGFLSQALSFIRAVCIIVVATMLVFVLLSTAVFGLSGVFTDDQGSRGVSDSEKAEECGASYIVENPGRFGGIEAPGVLYDCEDGVYFDRGASFIYLFPPETVEKVDVDFPRGGR